MYLSIHHSEWLSEDVKFFKGCSILKSCVSLNCYTVFFLSCLSKQLLFYALFLPNSVANKKRTEPGMYTLPKHVSFSLTLVLSDLVRTALEWNEDSSCVGTAGWGLQLDLIILWCIDPLSEVELSATKLAHPSDSYDGGRIWWNESDSVLIIWIRWEGLLGTLQDEKQDLSKGGSPWWDHNHLAWQLYTKKKS